MKISLRKSSTHDLPFMHEMLYEAIYWAKRENYPSFDEVKSDARFTKEFKDFGDISGDIGVVAESESRPIGAAWIRCWRKEDEIRGYISSDIPILAIAVAREYRHMGIGKKMMDALKNFAAKEEINKISLCVSKDNYAYNLYKQCGFIVYKDIGDSYDMLFES